MNDINNDEVRLFDSGKKLTFSDCPETSLDGIGSDLLSHDFLKDDNGIARGERDLEGGANFSEPLLIINNELSSQRRWATLDDVVDLDLSSLSTLEANGITQHPQESLGFTDFLSGGNFCLNGLSEKLSEPDKQLSFDSFSEIQTDSNVDKINGKEFKIVPTYVDGKLTNTLHLASLHSAEITSSDKIFQQIATTSSDLANPTVCSVTSSNEKITATIEDFPSISMVPGNSLTLNGQVQSHPSDIESDLSSLIQVKPKEPKKTKKKPVKTSFASTKKKKQKQKERKNAKEEAKNSGLPEKSVKKNSSDPPSKEILSIVTSSSTMNGTQIKPSESVATIGVPKFKIVQQTEHSAGSEILPVAANNFTDGLVYLPVTGSAPPTPLGTQPAVLTPVTTQPTQQQPIELILPVISVRDETSSKTVLKSISDLKPGDVLVGNQGLSQMQKQQIAVILKQREALKRATGSSSNGSKRNENKIICKVLYPEDFVEAKQNNPTNDAAKEDTSAKGSEDGNKSSEHPPKLKKPKIARTKEAQVNDRSKALEEFEEFEAGIPIAPSVTRSGRTSRPPKNLLKRNSKPTAALDKKDEPVQSTTNGISTTEGADAKPKPELLEGLPTKKKRPNYVCPGCNKAYIEAKIFLKHLESFPSHADDELTSKIKNEVLIPDPKPVVPAPGITVRQKTRCKCKCRITENCRARRLSFKQMVDTIGEREFMKTCGPRFAKTTSVWDFLLLRIKAIYKYEDYVKGVLRELGKLWESLKIVSAKILYPCDQPSENTVVIEDHATCEALGVSKGVYQTYPSGLETPPPNDVFSSEAEPSSDRPNAVPPPDTAQDISQSSLLSDILCDKSGMDTVDQLVNERLKTLAPGDDILDPPSDDLMTSLLNSVHSNSLTDSMFNPLMSGSNEDLLKALENLSNPTDNPPPLDFTALTND